MKNNNVYKMPMAALAMPLVVGMILPYWNDMPLTIKIFDLVITVAVMALGYMFYPLWKCLIVSFVMIFAGWKLMNDEIATTTFPNSERNQQSLTAKLLLISEPVDKGKRLKCDVCAIEADDPVWRCRNLLVYISKDQRANASLHMGDCIMAKFKPRPPQNQNGSFDYASYLRGKGFTAVAYISAYKWDKANDASLPLVWKLRMNACRLRNHLIRVYASHGVSGDGLALISALSLGKKDLMDKEMRDRFAGAGVAHVLAVSGMHVGIVYSFVNSIITLLWNCFVRLFKHSERPLLRKRIGLIINQILVVAILWIYAFITGMPASVIRAVTMFTLSAVAACLGRRSYTWNNLFFTAFLMLFLNPSYLVDIGFQMSFAAVVAILLFVPVFEQLLGIQRQDKMLTLLVGDNSVVVNNAEKIGTPTSHSRGCQFWRGVGNCVLSSLLISVAAQIGTAPLSIYYFHRFPQWFLLSNLVLVPIAVAVTWSALAFQCLAAIPFVPEIILNAAAAILSGLSKIFIDFALFVESLPGAVKDGLLPTIDEILTVYLLLGSLFYFFQKKKYLYTLENMLRRMHGFKYKKYLKHR